MFKWFTMLVTAASFCLFSSPIQCSLPVQSHDCVLKKTAKAPGAADPSGPLKERPEVQVDDDMADNADALHDDYDRILNEIGVEARHLDLALLPDQRPGARAVQLVQPRRNRPQIRASLAAAQQHARDQRIHRRLLPPQRPEEVDAEASRLEFFRLHRRERHAGQKFHPFLHMISLSNRFWL